MLRFMSLLNGSALELHLCTILDPVHDYVWDTFLNTSLSKELINYYFAWI